MATSLPHNHEDEISEEFDDLEDFGDFDDEFDDLFSEEEESTSEGSVEQRSDELQNAEPTAQQHEIAPSVEEMSDTIAETKNEYASQEERALPPTESVKESVKEVRYAAEAKEPLRRESMPQRVVSPSSASQQHTPRPTSILHRGKVVRSFSDRRYIGEYSHPVIAHYNELRDEGFNELFFYLERPAANVRPQLKVAPASQEAQILDIADRTGYYSLDEKEIIDHINESGLTRNDLALIDPAIMRLKGAGIDEAIANYHRHFLNGEAAALFLRKEGRSLDLRCKALVELTQEQLKWYKNDSEGGDHVKSDGKIGDMRYDFSAKEVMKYLSKRTLSPIELYYLEPFIAEYDKRHAKTWAFDRGEVGRQDTLSVNTEPAIAPCGGVDATYQNSSLLTNCDTITLTVRDGIIHYDGTGYNSRKVVVREHPLVEQYAENFSHAIEQFGCSTSLEQLLADEKEIFHKFNIAISKLEDEATDFPQEAATRGFLLAQPLYNREGSHLLTRSLGTVCAMMMEPKEKAILTNDSGVIDLESTQLGWLEQVNDEELREAAVYGPFVKGGLLFSFSDGIGDYLTKEEIASLFAANYARGAEGLLNSFKEKILEIGKGRGDPSRHAATGGEKSCKMAKVEDPRTCDDISFAIAYLRPKDSHNPLFAVK